MRQTKVIVLDQTSVEVLPSLQPGVQWIGNGIFDDTDKIIVGIGYLFTVNQTLDRIVMPQPAASISLIDGYTVVSYQFSSSLNIDAAAGGIISAYDARPIH